MIRSGSSVYISTGSGSGTGSGSNSNDIVAGEV